MTNAAKREGPVLRVFASGSASSSRPLWFGFTFKGVGSGFISSAGIPMLVSHALRPNSHTNERNSE